MLIVSQLYERVQGSVNHLTDTVILSIFRYFINGDLFHCICSEAFATCNTQSDSQFSWMLIAVTVIFFFIDSKMNTYIYASSRGKSLDNNGRYICES